jgi:hypothetical protein
LVSSWHLFTNLMLAVISSPELKNQDNMPVALELVPTRTIKMIIIKRINTPFGPHRIKDTEKSV